MISGGTRDVPRKPQHCSNRDVPTAETPRPMHVLQRLSPAVLAASLLPWLVMLAGTPRSAPAPAQAPAPAPSLRNREPIQQVDHLLRRAGWQPDGERQLDSLDRELSGNDLTSLRSCSGTGMGFCRYAYRRGRERLDVITIPNHNGDGLVHHWDLNGVAGDAGSRGGSGRGS